MYKVGDSAEMTKVFTEEDIFLFAGITGDRNPIHISKEFAAKSRFGERIAHGILTAGLISAVIGMKLPGPGCLYVSQTLTFLAPVRIGDEITARAEVVEMFSEKRMRLRTQCFNQRKELVLDGEAVIVPPRPGRVNKGTDGTGRPGTADKTKEVGE
jgi:3-hydroxybutyryl-CoA dehydratase